ncbi:MAG: flhB2 [Cyanobacteria bacterium RYN_339]|nr:flhB2 [Cyanobacteria bacterium RYN_339]
MAESGGQEKTEKPTPRRLSEARRKGQIAKSMDVNTAVVLFAAVLILKFQLTVMGERMSSLCRQMWGAFPHADYTPTTLQHMVMYMGWQFTLIAGPTLAFLLVAGVLANYIQVGVLFTTEPLKPSLGKINPIAGFQRMFSRRSLIETLKAIIKMTVVGYLVYGAIATHYPDLAGAALLDRISAAMLFAKVAWEIAWRATMALLVFGLMDYFYQRWEHEKGLRMTLQEIKDEAKQSEGDPLVKGRIRRAQREASRRRMMQEVPKATVVITNPTHYAVALMYDRDTMPAPVVVAKGMDLIAQRIKQIAAENDVPLVENVPLARALHKQVEIDDIIPEDLYAAVAEILVMVQKLNKPKSLVKPL